jgi:hypothetical protein
MKGYFREGGGPGDWAHLGNVAGSEAAPAAGSGMMEVLGGVAGVAGGGDGGRWGKEAGASGRPGDSDAAEAPAGGSGRPLAFGKHLRPTRTWGGHQVENRRG